MSEHLWPFLRLKAKSKKELKELYKKVYLDTYVRSPDGSEIEIYDWKRRRVYFFG